MASSTPAFERTERWGMRLLVAAGAILIIGGLVLLLAMVRAADVPGLAPERTERASRAQHA